MHFWVAKISHFNIKILFSSHFLSCHVVFYSTTAISTVALQTQDWDHTNSVQTFLSKYRKKPVTAVS